MLRHIGLTVTDSEEIENFYGEVLFFSMKHKFTINSKISQQIFNVNDVTDVYVMCQDDLEFEIFISHRKEKRVFSHVCLTYPGPEIIYESAVKSGYKALVKNGSDHNTYFIWDKSGNMFEIKKIQNS
jgi:hypothetical protein